MKIHFLSKWFWARPDQNFGPIQEEGMLFHEKGPCFQTLRKTKKFRYLLLNFCRECIIFFSFGSFNGNALANQIRRLRG